MSVWGITGSLASGKSTVLKLLRRCGAGVYDVDQKIHQYYKDKSSPVYKKVAVHFPSVVRGGGICRKRLGALVFSQHKLLRRLERIVHPAVTKDLKQWIRRVQKKRGVYAAEVPLLFEKKLAKYFDGVILVAARRKVIMARARKKSLAAAPRRLALSLPVKEKIKRSDIVINNNLDIKELKRRVGALWEKQLKKG